jgi:hypothetical protein
MKVAILEYSQDQKSATGVRGRAIKDYLEKIGHFVEILTPRPERIEWFNRERYAVASRLKRRLLRRKTLPHLWDFVADELESPIRRGQFDVIIGRGPETGYALTRPLEGLKIFDMLNIVFLENYYAWNADLNEVEETFEKEKRIFESVDYILSTHDLQTEYFLQHFDGKKRLTDKVVTVRLGCDPVSRYAEFSQAPRIVYAGSYYFIQDPYLLAYLTKITPFAIDCYGPKDPNRTFFPAPLNYKGYASAIDFLADYQLGIITVSRDTLRQYSPATKFPYYFAHGLPVLFPDWMKEGYTYPQCAIPFNEENFVAQAKSAVEPATWQRMSEAAKCLANQLQWTNVLTPLGELIAAERQQGQQKRDDGSTGFART